MATQKILTRDFILCFSAQLTFTSVFHILIPTLPIYLSRLGSTEAEIGVLIGALFVSSLILRPFVGRGLVKIPERHFMIAGALIFALASVAYIIAPPFWPFLFVRFFQGIGIALFYTASSTFIANISPEAHRGQSLSYFYLAFNISFALAPAFGMFFINAFTFNLLFLLCLGISLSSLFLTTRLRKRQMEPVVDPSQQDEPFLSRETIPPAIMAFLAHVIWGALTAFFPLYSIQNGVANPGFFFAAYAIVLILGRALGARILDLYSREKIILPCLTTYIISMVVLAYSKTLPMFILVGVIWGSGNAFLMPTLVAYALDRAVSSPGTVMGTYTAISDLGVALGPIIMGVILRFTSYPTMFLCLALVGVTNLSYFYFFVRKGKAKDRNSFSARSY
jgi:MFS family permease